MSSSTVTIRDVDDALKARLRDRAALHGRSMEDEARDILQSALAGDALPPPDLAKSIRDRLAPLGGLDLPSRPRDPIRDPEPFGS